MGIFSGLGQPVLNQAVANAPNSPVLAEHSILSPNIMAPNRAPATAQPVQAATGRDGHLLGAETSAGGGSSSGGGNGYGSGNANQINNVYDTSSNYYRALLDTIGGQQSADNATTDRQYNSNFDSLTHQRNAASAALDNQTNVLGQTYSRSLNQLGNNIRSQYQGQSNQLGVNGAGDSSAVGQLGYALGQLQNTNRSSMNQDLNNQLNQVGLTRTAQDNQFGDAKRQLDDWKYSQYQNIAKQYAQLQQQIGSQLANNEQARKNALMYAGQWAQNQAAGIDATLAQSLDALHQSYAQAANPNVSLSNMPTYTAQNINAPTIPIQSDLSQPANISTTTVNPYHKDQNQTF